MAGVRWAVFGCGGLVRRQLAGLVALRVILGGLNGLIVILLLVESGCAVALLRWIRP
jgi:hypothetical protein